MKKDVLGWADLDIKSIDKTINFIEAKEMARDALAKYTVTAGVSTYKTKVKGKDKPLPEKISCKDCDKMTDKFIWSKRSGKMVECTQCISCWRRCSRRGKQQTPFRKSSPARDESNAVMIGSVEMLSQGKHMYVAANTKPKVKQKGELVLDHYIF